MGEKFAGYPRPGPKELKIADCVSRAVEYSIVSKDYLIICMLKSLPAAKWDYRTAAHLLARAGFGGPPDEIQKLAGLTLNQAVERFVDYEKTPDPTPAPAWAKPEAEAQRCC